MNIKLIGIIVLAASAVGLGVFLGLSNGVDTEEPATPPEQVNDTVPVDDEDSLLEEILSKLPYEATIDGRTVVFDEGTVELLERSEYAMLPYEVEIGEETRLIESEMMIEGDETPIDFVKRYLRDRGPEADVLETYPEHMYERMVSLYPLDPALLDRYPAGEERLGEVAEEGVSVVVRTMNFPDDAIGGEETRFDFIVTEANNWLLVWHGERVFCRRMDDEFWQPANLLCP